jgi:hypothetical protein
MQWAESIKPIFLSSGMIVVMAKLQYDYHCGNISENNFITALNLIFDAHNLTEE